MRASRKVPSSRARPSQWLERYERFAVFGLGRSGVAAANLLARRGKAVVASDARGEEELSIALTSLHDSVDVRLGANVFEGVEVIVASPGLKPSLAIFDAVRAAQIPIISEIELAFDAACASFVCITGTDGKTTTTSLVGAILEEAGLEHVVAGNIGTPLCEVVEGISDEGFVVAEVSAFQLWTTHHFHPHMAIFTNLAGDHLDYFDGDYTAYGDAKRKLITHMDASYDRLWLSGADEASIAWQKDFGASAGLFVVDRDEALSALAHEDGALACVEDNALVYHPQRVHMSEPPIVLAHDVSSLGLSGRHNITNMLAAAALCFELGVDPDVIERACRAFHGLPHRFEAVGCVDGIQFIDDSKATNAHAALAGLTGVDFAHLVVITGGVDKGLDLAEFVSFLSSLTEAVVLIGELAPRLEAELLASGLPREQIVRAASMKEAVECAYERAKPLQATVVLSPASSSFDMFESYAHRGEVFQACVRALDGEQHEALSRDAPIE